MLSPAVRLFRWALLLLLLVQVGDPGQAQDKTPVVAALKGHTETVYAIAFSPDGKFTVTGSFDKSVRLWDALTGKEVKTFGGAAGSHANLVLAVAFSPNGQLVASGGSDNVAKLWDVPVTSHLREFVHGEAVRSLALSADGKLLAGAAADGTVKLWNAADGKLLHNLAGHVGPVQGVAFNAKGDLLASTAADGTVRFWNAADGKPGARLGAHTAPASSVLFHPNGTSLASASDDGTAKLWTLPSPAERALPPHGDAVTALTLSPDGAQVFSASADRTVRQTTLANGQVVRPFAGPTAPVLALAALPTLVAAGTADHRLFLWNGADGKLLTQALAHQGPVSGAALHPQGTQLLTGGGDGLLKLWALPAVPARALPHPDAVAAAALAADNKRVVTGGADKIVRTWTLANNQVERQFPGHTGVVTAVALSPNAAGLVSGGDDATIRVWNQTNGQQADLIGAHAGPVTALAFHPNSAQLLSASEDGTLKLWQFPPVAPKSFAHPDAVTSAVLSPDGAKLLTGANDKQARIWNLANGQQERALGGATLPVTAVAYSANGAAVAAGSADKSLTVWNAGDGKELKKLTNLPAPVLAVAFAADPNIVAAGFADNSLRLFDVKQGMETKNLPGAGGPVSAVAFTPKGDLVIAASHDRSVRVWNVSDGMVKLKVDHGAVLQALAVSKDGTKFASGGADKLVKVWNLADGKLLHTITTPAEVRGVGMSPDGTRLVVAGVDNRARTYTLDGKLGVFCPHDGPVLAAAFHPDGKQLVTASADKTARLWSPTLLWQAAHAGPIRQAGFSPKGDRVVSGSDDKTVKLWNAADGKEIKSLAAHAGPVTGVGISADGLRIASAGADNSVKVWTPDTMADKPLAAFPLPGPAQAVALSPNGLRVAAAFVEKNANLVRVYDVATGKELLTFVDNAGPVRVLAFAADNRTLLAGGQDKHARLLDVGTLAVFDAHPGGVAGVQFHANGTQAVSAGADRTVKLWNLADGKVLKTFGPLEAPAAAVAFSKDGTQVGAAAGKNVKVWNAADGKELATLSHPADVRALAFSTDKLKVVTGAADNQTRVWDIAAGKLLQSFAQAGPVSAVAFHPDSKTVISGSADKTLTVQTVSAAKLLPVAAAPVRSLAMVPAGTHLLTASDDKAVKLWNLTSGAAERSFDGATGAVQAVALSKNGALVAAGGADKMVRVYTFADGKLLATLNAPGAVRGLAFSPNNQALAAACDNQAAATWNVLSTPGQPLPADFGKPLQAYGVGQPAFAVAYGPDNASLYTAGQDKSIKLWKAPSDAARPLAHPNLVDAVAFDGTSTKLATGCHDGNVRIWDVVKGAVSKQIAAHAAPQPAAIYCVAWTPDGKQVLSGSLDRSLKLHDAASGSLVREFKAYKEKEFDKGHRDGVFAAAFSPDGQLMASAGSDRCIKLWKVADGSVVREFSNPALKANQVAPGQPARQPQEAHPGWIYGVRFTPDGKYLISAGNAPKNQGYLAVWNVADGKLVHSAELPQGPVNHLALTADGKLLGIACSPASRQFSEVPSYILKAPVP